MHKLILILLLFSNLLFAEKQLTDEEVNDIIKWLGKDQHYNVSWNASSEFALALKHSKKCLKREYHKLYESLPEKLKQKVVDFEDNSYLKLIKYVEKNPFSEAFTKYSFNKDISDMDFDEFQELKRTLLKSEKQIQQLFNFSQQTNFNYHLKGGLVNFSQRIVAKCFKHKIHLALVNKNFDEALEILEKGIALDKAYESHGGATIHGLISMSTPEITNNAFKAIILEKGIQAKHLQEAMALYSKAEYKTASFKKYLKGELQFLIGSIALLDVNNKKVLKYQILEEQWPEVAKKPNPEKFPLLKAAENGFNKQKFLKIATDFYLKALQDCEQESLKDMTKSKDFAFKIIKELNENSLSHTFLKDYTEISWPSLKKLQALKNRQRVAYLSAAIRLYELKTGGLPDTLQKLIDNNIISSIPRDAITGGPIKYDKKKRSISAESGNKDQKVIFELIEVNSKAPKKGLKPRNRGRSKRFADDPFAK